MTETCPTCRAFAAHDSSGKTISRCYAKTMFDGESITAKEVRQIPNPEAHSCERYLYFDPNEVLPTKPNFPYDRVRIVGGLIV